MKSEIGKYFLAFILGICQILSLSATGKSDDNIGEQAITSNEYSNEIVDKESHVEEDLEILSPRIHDEYKKAIKKTAEMIYDEQAIRLASRYGLDIVNVTWEDTGRYYNSSVGPNISDMTIQVSLNKKDDSGYAEVTAMPVIRYPNYEDLSTDLSPKDFTLLVGNEKGKDLKRISLYDFLESPRDYMTDPSSWKGLTNSLIASRDSKVLVSAQACFLPVPKGSKAYFNPVLFNYQSYEKNPAVLTLLVTREGTSMTIIDNQRDSFEEGYFWGQRLFHNRNGEKASLTGQRMSDFEKEISSSAEIKQNQSEVLSEENALNMVLLIQIPLKQKLPNNKFFYDIAESSSEIKMMSESEGYGSNVENAVIGSGNAEGPFVEVDGLKIKRDRDFPIRVTIQFYKATSNGIVSEKDIDEISHQIRKVYAQGDYVSSLVTGGGAGRVTEYYGIKVQPRDWWSKFWLQFEREHGLNKEEAILRLRDILGDDYAKKEVSDLYIRDLLK